MVNTGRPSPACKACRARRLKCDQTKPGCIKCIKAKRICPGYREAFEVNFKDQTESVIQKHGRASTSPPPTVPYSQKARKRNASLPSLSSTARVSPRDEEDTSPPRAVCKVAKATSPRYTLPLYNISHDPSIPHQATCYFMSTYVNVSCRSSNAGSLQFLAPLVSATSQNPTLRSAFMAVSMAAMASRPNSGALAPLARTYYHDAVANAGKMLKEKERSKEDQSLAAIIMLIYYETLMWENATGNVISHARGAQAIVVLRDASQKKSSAGYAMFDLIRSIMIRQYAHSPTYDVEEMAWWVNARGESIQPYSITEGLNVETTVLRRQLADFLESAPDSASVLTAIWIYAKAKKLATEIRVWFNHSADGDQILDYWQEDVPEETIHLSRAFPGRVYTFDDVFVAGRYLNVHLQWLALAEVMATISRWMQTQCPNLDLASAQRAQAIALAEEQVAEIISIAPYYCQWPTYKSPSPLGGLACSLPLFMTGLSPYTTRKQQAFLMGRLRHISDASGLKLTGTLADNLAASRKARVELDRIEAVQSGR